MAQGTGGEGGGAAEGSDAWEQQVPRQRQHAALARPIRAAGCCVASSSRRPALHLRV
jgi:hypothetical protein